VFRDNMEAMQARIDTLESAMEAERQAREAAEAKERAAQVEARELRLRLDRSGVARRSPLRPAIYAATAAAALSAIVFLALWLAARDQVEVGDRRNLDLRAKLERARKAAAELTDKLRGARQENDDLRAKNAKVRSASLTTTSNPSREQVVASMPGLRACLERYRAKHGSDAVWRVAPSGTVELPPEVSGCIVEIVGAAFKGGGTVRSTTIIRSGSRIKVQKKVQKK